MHAQEDTMENTETAANRNNAARAATATAPAPVEKATAFAEKPTAFVSDSLKHTAETAARGLKDAQAEVTGSLAQATGLARAYAEVQRDALESVMKAGQIYSEGLKAIATHATETNRAQFEETLAHLRALTGVKSIHEAMALQTQYARTAASQALIEGSTLVENGLKLAEEMLAPLTARAREAAAKVKTSG
jgi:phasin family protein